MLAPGTEYLGHHKFAYMIAIHPAPQVTKTPKMSELTALSQLCERRRRENNRRMIIIGRV